MLVEYCPGMRMEGGWVLLSCMTSGDELTEVVAASVEDGIAGIASWRRTPGGEWEVYSVDAEGGYQQVTAYDPDEGDVVPMVPPRILEPEPIPMVLFCPRCGHQHVDAPDPAVGWTDPPHKSHECQGCKHVFRPADVPTTGVLDVKTRGAADASPAVRGQAVIGNSFDWAMQQAANRRLCVARTTWTPGTGVVSLQGGLVIRSAESGLDSWWKSSDADRNARDWIVVPK